ncbi:MAG: D-aminoacyl-tRNA deacylase [Halococcoides sp.]
MIGIVVSAVDPASVAIRDALESQIDWSDRSAYRRSADGRFAMRSVEQRHLDLVHPEAAFPAIDRLLVVSKHAGETGRLVTAHAPGNIASADHGGEPATLPPADPSALDAILAGFREHAPPEYEVGMECTHHGPTAVDVPITFVEIGSDADAWHDESAARAVSRAIADLPDRLATGDPRPVAGFGGGHYVPRFERIQRDTDWAVGHVAADWALDELGDPREHAAIVAAVLDRSGADLAVVDGDHPGVEAVLADSDHRIVSETWLREADGVPIDRVAALEAALGPIDGGLAIGEAAARVDDWSIASIPADLIDIARAVDREAVTALLRAHCVAIDRENDQPTGRVAVGPEGPPIDPLIGVIDREHRVERADDTIAIERRVFDPERARAMDVPDGPAFGRLANGESIEVDGESIDPDDVHRIETTRIDLE